MTEWTTEQYWHHQNWKNVINALQACYLFAATKNKSESSSFMWNFVLPQIIMHIYWLLTGKLMTC